MKTIDENCCEVSCTHDTLIEMGRIKLANEHNIQNLVDFYHTLGNETRLKIITILDSTELCVCDIAEIINLSIPATSQQLKILRGNNFINQRKEGRAVYYSLKADYSFDEIKKNALEV